MKKYCLIFFAFFSKFLFFDPINNFLAVNLHSKKFRYKLRRFFSKSKLKDS